MSEVPLSTPELTRGNRKSQLHEFTGELPSTLILTTSHVVHGSNCRTQLFVEESRADTLNAQLLNQVLISDGGGLKNWWRNREVQPCPYLRERVLY